LNKKYPKEGLQNAKYFVRCAKIHSSYLSTTRYNFGFLPCLSTFFKTFSFRAISPISFEEFFRLSQKKSFVAFLTKKERQILLFYEKIKKKYDLALLKNKCHNIMNFSSSHDSRY